MTFEIRNVRTNELIAGPYDKMVSARRSYTSRGLLPSEAVIADTEWRTREQARKNLINLELFGLVPIPDHYLHVSIKSDGLELMVSYTENEIKGQRNLQKAGMKIGRYLGEFYPNLGAVALRDKAAEITAKELKLGLRLAYSREEIKWVYEHSKQSASSCMTYNLRDYPSNPAHPAEGYHGPDLAVAYITDDSNTNVVGRAVVWPAKKKWNRIYGTQATKLEKMLVAEGYLQGSMTGAKMTPFIRPYNGGGENPYDRAGYKEFVMPYTDNERYVHFDGEFMVMGQSREHENVGTNTNGTVGLYFYVSVISGKKLPSVSRAITALHPRTGIGGYVLPEEMELCWTNDDGLVYHPVKDEENNATNYIVGGDGKTYPAHYAQRYMVLCAVTGLRFRPADTLRTTDGNVCFKAFMKNYAMCELTGRSYRRSVMYWMEHQAWWSSSSFKRFGYVGPDGKNYANHLRESEAA